MRTKLIGLALACVLAGGLPAAGLSGEFERQAPPLRDAMRMAKEGKFDQAADTIRQFMAQPGADLVKAHQSLGLVYYKARRYDNALAAFAQTVGMRRESPMAHYFLGLIYEKKALTETGGAAQDMKKKALDAWRSYLEYAGTPGMRSEAHSHIGTKAEENIARAKQHIAVLEEELRHE